MRDSDIPKLIEQLLIEVTTQRLITRAIVGHMVANSRRRIPDIIASFGEAMDKTAPDLFPLPDVDPELQAKASALAKTRADALIANLGAAVAPPRANAMKRPVRTA